MMSTGLIPSFDPVLFWNTLFDKGLIACIVVAAGLLANRSLEHYRSRTALYTEAAKTRLARIGELWEELAEDQARAELRLLSFYNTLLAHLKVAGVTGLPERIDVNRPESLERLDAVAIPATVITSVREAIAQDQFFKGPPDRINALQFKLRRYRFWLGKDLERAMFRYALQMQVASVAMFDSGAKAAIAWKAIKELDSARADVEHVLRNLLRMKPEKDAPSDVTFPFAPPTDGAQSPAGRAPSSAEPEQVARNTEQPRPEDN